MLDDRELKPLGCSFVNFIRQADSASRFDVVRDTIAVDSTVRMISSTTRSANRHLSARYKAANVKVKNILVPVDFSECSLAAVEYAFELAEKQNEATVYLLHVNSKGSDSAGAAVEGSGEVLERLGKLVPAEKEIATKTIKAVVGGSPAAAIVAYANQHDIDMIVMGTHGRTGFAHWTLGSVAERVLRSAPCPVVVIPGHDRANRAPEAIEALTSKFGKTHAGNKTVTSQQFNEELQRALKIPAKAAAALLERLEQRKWIRWTEKSNGTGEWAIATRKEVTDSIKGASESPAVDLIERAHNLRATDVHIDPDTDGEYSVRLRIDGKIQRYCMLSENVAEHLINRLKVMARVDIADPFRPKEGRLQLPSHLQQLEVRMTTAPVAGGESVALRILSKEDIFFRLDELGFGSQELEKAEEMVRRADGLVLVTGPTGGGKSTTVYSMLQSLTHDDRIVVSIEDPVEYSVPFVRQMNADVKHGITLTEGLKTILRMDPDAIFLGEIRDRAAADIAMRAASSGRFVMSTLHTRDVASTVTALRDLGISDRSISANLTGVINQRLLRKLCTECREPTALDERQRAMLEQFGLEIPDTVYAPVGCPVCRNTGYLGRTGVFQVALIQNHIASAIAEGCAEQDLRRMLEESGCKPLEREAYRKVAAGLTDFNEATSIGWMS